MKTREKVFGKLNNGKKVMLYTIENNSGMKVILSDYGASIINLYVKDKDDNLLDVALGHNSFQHYISNPGNLGCVVGRNANRIKDAKVTIDDIDYQLEVNDGNNNLHTGSNGLHTTLFTAKTNNNKVIFNTTVEHLEDGFPGNLHLEVKYTLSQDNQLSIEYKATSDKDTIVNITNHNYFNLNGQDASNIYNQKLKINADFYTPNTKESIPSGEVLKVDNTVFDFRSLKNLNTALNSNEKQVTTFGGIDHNFMLNNNSFNKVATLYNPDNKIVLDVLSDRYAMHVYTANHFPDKTTINKNNITYPLHGGIAFETQSVPNALNMPWIKSPIVKAKKLYYTKTAFKFSIK